MKDIASIVIILNTQLELYLLDPVKPGLELIDFLAPNDTGLELFDRFERLWKKHWDQYLHRIDTMYFLVGKQAGFTDTRVVWIWLKSWKMFDFGQARDFRVGQLSLTPEQLNSSVLKEIPPHDSIIYSQLPKIGVSKSKHFS